MEFKGTKGKWYTIETYSQMGSDDTTVASLNNNYVFTTEDKHGDQKADAVLISCAPEMLEMLKECITVINWYRDHTNPNFSEDMDGFNNHGRSSILRIKKLIHEATNI